MAAQDHVLEVGLLLKTEELRIGLNDSISTRKMTMRRGVVQKLGRTVLKDGQDKEHCVCVVVPKCLRVDSILLRGRLRGVSEFSGMDYSPACLPYSSLLDTRSRRFTFRWRFSAALHISLGTQPLIHSSNLRMEVYHTYIAFALAIWKVQRTPSHAERMSRPYVAQSVGALPLCSAEAMGSNPAQSMVEEVDGSIEYFIDIRAEEVFSTVASVEDRTALVAVDAACFLLGQTSIRVFSECFHAAKVNCEYEGLPLTSTVVEPRPASSLTGCRPMPILRSSFKIKLHGDVIKRQASKAYLPTCLFILNAFTRLVSYIDGANSRRKVSGDLSFFGNDCRERYIISASFYAGYSMASCVKVEWILLANGFLPSTCSVVMASSLAASTSTSAVRSSTDATVLTTSSALMSMKYSMEPSTSSTEGEGEVTWRSNKVAESKSTPHKLGGGGESHVPRRDRGGGKKRSRKEYRSSSKAVAGRRCMQANPPTKAIPAPGFSHVGLVPDDAAGRRFSRGTPVTSGLSSGVSAYSPRFTLIFSQNLDQSNVGAQRVAAVHLGSTLNPIMLLPVRQLEAFTRSNLFEADRVNRVTFRKRLRPGPHGTGKRPAPESTGPARSPRVLPDASPRAPSQPVEFDVCSRP
ncbi:hypothetical protein PR048_029815 [Dryococelus australis]|uniref:Uncharacterized protein n=1 Tax=Dryococelus australis TaxID=614101 RepID=A0ABQ9G769_9NEOP|nr:hypothetical protein PR048_029815 [Dryococelus australis]